MAHGPIRIVIAEKKHKDGILQLLKDSFIPRQPIWAALGATWEDGKERFEKLVDDALVDPVSFVAIDEETAPGNKIIGCRLAKLIDFSDPGDLDEDYVNAAPKNKKAEIIDRLYNELMRSWKREFVRVGARKILKVMTLCVDDAYGHRGVAQKLAKRGLEHARTIGVDYGFSTATNWRTLRIVEKLGFEVWRTLEYAAVVDPDTGKPYVTPTDGSTGMQWVVQKIGKPIAHL